MDLEPQIPESIAISMKKITENLKKTSAYDETESANREKLRNGETLFLASEVPARHRKAIPAGKGPWGDHLYSMVGRLGGGFIFALLGNRGTGKTQMAVGLVRHNSFERQKSSFYTKALDIFIMLREGFRKDGDSESKIIKHFTKPSLLIIDAMEERGETPFEDRLLNHIIDKRYDSLLDTVLISNQTPEAFAASAGPSIVSRIHETGDKLVCDWQSFRTKK